MLMLMSLSTMASSLNVCLFFSSIAVYSFSMQFPYNLDIEYHFQIHREKNLNKRKLYKYKPTNCYVLLFKQMQITKGKKTQNTTQK